MDYCVDDNARKDLREALSKYGCLDAEAAAIKIEDLLQAYHCRFLAQGDMPAAVSLAEAARIIDSADAARCEIADIGETTRRRMIRSLEAREEDMSLPQYMQAVNDVCMFGIYARDKAENEVLHSERKADSELRLLIAKIIKVLCERTGGDLPDAPTWTDHPDRTWRYSQRLEQHPIWIVARLLGIRLDPYGVSVLIKSVTFVA